MKKKNIQLNTITAPPLAEEDLGAVAGGMTANEYRLLALEDGRTRPLPQDLGLCECGARMSRFCVEVVDSPSHVTYLDVKCYACDRTYESLEKKKPGWVDDFVPPGR